MARQETLGKCYRSLTAALISIVSILLTLSTINAAQFTSGITLQLTMVAATLAYPAPENNYHREHILVMLDNLKKWTGFDLIAEYGFSVDRLGEQIFNADFYILSHDRSTDPILTYGNQRVLDLWEVSWAELTAMPSRKTAKPIEREARAAMINKVKTDNYLTGYSGIRISKTGKEFYIANGTIWNLFANNGESCGQAAWFKSVDNLIL